MGKILVIDDDELLLRVISCFLEYGKHGVTCCKNPLEAGALLGEGQFNLIISDVFMPEKNGLQLVLELQDQFPDIKIILMSGGMETSHVDMLGFAEQLDSIAKLPKPIDKDDLLSLVDQVLNGTGQFKNLPEESVQADPETCIEPSDSVDDNYASMVNMDEYNDFIYCEFTRETVSEFVDQFNKNDLEVLLLNLEDAITHDKEDKKEVITETFREVHSLKGTACFCKLEPIIFYLRNLEDALGIIRSDIYQITGTADRSIFDALLNAIDIADLFVQEMCDSDVIDSSFLAEHKERTFKMLSTFSTLAHNPDLYFNSHALNEDLF